MELEILVFKESGKLYESTVVMAMEDMYLFTDEFKQFVKSSVPADIGEGYILVRDFKENASFHIKLYKYEEIMGKVEINCGNCKHCMDCKEDSVCTTCSEYNNFEIK